MGPMKAGTTEKQAIALGRHMLAGPRKGESIDDHYRRVSAKVYGTGGGGKARGGAAGGGASGS